MSKLKEISVQEGLVKLKLYDAKIERATREGQMYFLVNEAGKTAQKGKQTKESLAEEAKAAFQQAMDLIDNRNKLKQAIVQSNALTQVTIAGVEYSVAEAIETKTSIVYKQSVLNQLKINHRQAELALNKHNEQVKRNHDTKVQTLLGSQTDNKESLKTLIEQMELLAESQMLMIHEFDVNKNESNIQVMNRLEDEINEFLSEVDYKLTESNVITKISL